MPLHHWRIQSFPQIFADTTCPCRALRAGRQHTYEPAALRKEILLRKCAITPDTRFGVSRRT
eukprot:1178432-Prorocentrum_minimum.AAC.3